MEDLLEAVIVVYACLHLLRNFKKYQLFRREKFPIMYKI